MCYGNSTKDYEVLVIEPAEDQRRVLCDWLRGMGLRTRESASAADAFRKMSEDAPDMILSAAELPDENGFLFCRNVRMHEEFSTLLFVCISPKNSFDILVQAFEQFGP